MKNLLWNMFACIKNGHIAKKPFIIIPRKKICGLFLNILWDEGFILGYKLSGKRLDKFKILLKYKNGKPSINTLITITKPGQRKYYTLNQLWKIKLNNELLIISTNQGLLTLDECKKLQLGGEPFIMVR